MGVVDRVLPQALVVAVSKKSVVWAREHDQKHTSPKHNRRKRITSAQLFNLVRRVAGICAALVYASIGLEATRTTVAVLRGTPNGRQHFGIMESKLIVEYAGDSLIRDSPLVKKVLGEDTTPRNETIYLLSPTETSFTACTGVDNFDANIYGHSFLKSGFEGLMAASMYNLTFLQDLELIVPVVDCTSPALVTGDPSLLRAYSLMRAKNNHRDVRILSATLSVQDYRIPDQNRHGPAVVSALFSIDDMQATEVKQHFVVGLDYPYKVSPETNVYTLDGVSAEGFWEMSSVPRNAVVDPITKIQTARRRGFYLHAESKQVNMKNLIWEVELESPARSLSVREWYGEPIIFDSWAWVHGIHFIFACQTIFSLGVLAILVFRNFRLGKIWIGDAFAAFSTSTLVVRAGLVLGSWYVNEYWTLIEFFLFSANGITNTQYIPIHSELVHADLIVVFLSVFGLIGHIFKERIDPAFGLLIFEVVHSYRQKILHWVPPVLKAITEFSDAEYRRGISPVTEEQQILSPMRIWTTHDLEGINFKFIFTSIFPKYVMICFVLGLVTARKLYKIFHRASLAATVTSSGPSDRSSVNEKAPTTQKGNLTNFELSTGAELEARYGLISDYKNYVFFKGLKFASADGVYCSGYVVANGKFLVGSSDLLSIIIIKAFRSRFTNVYVYAVDGNTVQRTAQLVYPETLSWQDLISLNINILA